MTSELRECIDNCFRCHSTCVEVAGHCLRMGGAHAGVDTNGRCRIAQRRVSRPPISCCTEAGFIGNTAGYVPMCAMRVPQVANS